MERVRLVSGRANSQNGGVYFPGGRTPPPCIRSGCAWLDCVLGGGWAQGKIANIVGDKSAGKTLLAIEACANFARQWPKGRIFYRESEAAFDLAYAQDLGLPIDRVDFGPEGIDTLWDTVEEIFADLNKQLAKSKGEPMLYIIDSLDALSDAAEMEREFGEASYGTGKATRLSEMFRRLVRKIREAKCTLIIISQIRDNIGVKFGSKVKRSGGHALDFYASQVIWLHHLKMLTQQVRGVTRPTAIRVRAKCTKNKVSAPFHECEFTIRFSYGIEDMEASIDYLEQVKMLKNLGITSAGVDKFLDAADEDVQLRNKLRDTVIATWAEVESRFKPTKRKYDE